VAEEMGVRYVLEGSIQSEGARVRITAQLIDALSGQHLFSERYDRDMKGFLALQDEIALRVFKKVLVNLTEGEECQSGKGTKNLEAYLKVTQAMGIGYRRNKENLEKSRKLLEEAVALDPLYARAYTGLAFIQIGLISIGASESPQEAKMKALDFSKKALALDDSDSAVHCYLSWSYMFLGEQDKSLSEAKKAVSLNPNSATAYHCLGWCLRIVGRHQEALPYLQKSLRLSPIPISSNILESLADSYTYLGRYDEAVATLKKELQFFGPDTLLAHLYLARTYVAMGREKEARTEGAEVLRIDPNFKVDRYADGVLFFRKNPAARARAIETLHTAGLK
jgi:adenylate cyclase